MQELLKTPKPEPLVLQFHRHQWRKNFIVVGNLSTDFQQTMLARDKHAYIYTYNILVPIVLYTINNLLEILTSSRVNFFIILFYFHISFIDYFN